MADVRQSDYDAIVVGAGFGGIYMLHKLRNELGLRVRAFDRAGGVGGTWFWNRYPGAMSDTESFVYRYSFDRELLQEWEWNTRYLNQPDILAYLQAVVERHDLGKDIQLNTGVDAAEFDETTNRWTVRTDTGESFTAAYLVTALGLLSKINLPEIPGRDSFAGRLAHTGAWPQDLTLAGKRVGVIGTGSTGTQFICAASKLAAHLTVFQRSAQYSVPSGNGPVSGEYVADMSGPDTTTSGIRCAALSSRSASRRARSPQPASLRRNASASSRRTGTSATASGSCSAPSTTSRPTR